MKILQEFGSRLSCIETPVASVETIVDIVSDTKFTIDLLLRNMINGTL